MIDKKIRRRIFIGVGLYFIIAIFYPRGIYDLKIYFSAKDIKHFIELAKKGDPVGLANLTVYYIMKSEIDNVKYLGCYVHQQKYIKYETKLRKTYPNFKEMLENCPKDPLSHIKNHVTFFDYLEYKYDSLVNRDTKYITSDGRDGTSEIHPL